MTSRKTQDELEQTVKGYQLQAVETKVDSLETKVDSALVKLDTVINQTKGVVTQEQLNEVKKELREYTDKEIQEATKQIHLQYQPMQDNLKWFVRAVIGQGIIIIAGVIVAAIAFFAPKG